MSRWLRAAGAGTAVIMLSAAAAAAQPKLALPALEDFERASIYVETRDGARPRLRVYLALTPAQRARGLMFVEDLAPDEGMLFLYPHAQFVAMWMKDTELPLDMLFIGPGGFIRQIEGPTEPHSLKSIYSDDAVLAVLELEAGTAERLGIRVGDRLVYRWLIDAATRANAPD